VSDILSMPLRFFMSSSNAERQQTVEFKECDGCF